MARHSGCPECHSSYNANLGNSSADTDGSGEQRAGPSSLSNGQTSPTAIYNPYYTGRPRTPANGSKHTPIDRQEIIRRIKSGGSRPTSPELERPSSRSSLRKRKSPTPVPELSAPLVSESRAKSPEIQQDNEAIGLQIERPRSAFHSGDFREKEESTSSFERFGDSTGDDAAPSLSTSPVAPWHPEFPSAGFRQTRQVPATPPGLPIQRATRSRTVSNASLAASFIYKPPTSPLVQASRPDTPEPPQRQKSRSPDKSRRHTFSPQSLQSFQSALNYPASARNSRHNQTPSLRAEKTFPYQAHQPRRSLNSFASLPQTPAPGPRRPSISDSPLHHAPMVGSYEESILRGRMSTAPSKPLNFVAQIGVLGKGDCKPNLRCPPHATVPFPAVFYSYGTGGTRAATSTDQPSPYVGLIDLENHLPPVSNSPEKRRQRIQAALSDEGSRPGSRTRGGGGGDGSEEISASASDGQQAQAQLRRLRQKQKQKRRSGSPKAPPGGSYRIPAQGQLQIIIKNPNKTAVKLFLVPYDLSDMEPGQKTFIRQRSYSAGPIIDMPLSSRRNLGTDRPEAALSACGSEERPMLRYLVHLHICCPARGRFFLYKAVRVVFANRVPDGKERLRNEIQLPEPRYSAYKPGRDSNVGVIAAANSAAPKESGAAAAAAAWRRSAVDSAAMPSAQDDDRTTWTQHHRLQAQSLPSTEYGGSDMASMQPLPFHINAHDLPTLESRSSSQQKMSGEEMDLEPGDSELWRAVTQPSRSAFSSLTTSNFNNDVGDSSNVSLSSLKRLEDPFSFGRDRSRERKPGARSESLLSRRLKDLAFQAQRNGGNGVEEV